MTEMLLLFWSCAFLIVYPYVGYLALLRVLTLLKRVRGEYGAFEPSMTLIISAYNEEKVIEDKILNSLALDYPENKLEIVLISDGSDDRTTEIAAKYKKRVTLRHYPGRIGKTACLNKAVPLAKGELVVFSDANSNYEKNALRLLARNFSSPEVGFATGRTEYAREDGTGRSIGFYSRLEMLTKSLESLTGSCVGADGAIFAIRKTLFRPLRASDINDFVIPLDIVRQGYRGVLEQGAVCTERTSGSGKGEFRRQVRISARTLKALFRNADLLNPMRHGFFSFELASHKLLRMFVPFFMILLFATNIALASEGPAYLALLALQSAFYLSAVAGHWLAGAGAASRLFSISYTFTSVNMAVLWAWVKFLKGESFVTWAPTQR